MLLHRLFPPHLTSSSQHSLWACEMNTVGLSPPSVHRAVVCCWVGALSPLKAGKWRVRNQLNSDGCVSALTCAIWKRSLCKQAYCSIDSWSLERCENSSLWGKLRLAQVCHKPAANMHVFHASLSYCSTNTMLFILCFQCIYAVYYCEQL